MNKNLLPIVLGLVAILSPIRADDITLSDGTVLKNAKIVQRDESTKTVTVSFSGGIAQVHSEMMPAELATAQPPTVTNAVSQTTPVPQPPTPEPPNTPIPTDWTVDGRDYHNVKVTEVDADRVHITYDGGLGTVMLPDLTPELQQRFNYDPVAAKRATQERSQQASQADAELTAEMRQNAKADAAQVQQDKNAAQGSVSADRAQADADAKEHLKLLQQDYEQKVAYADSHHGAGGKEEGEARKQLTAYEAWMRAQGLSQ